jgi:amino acid transporter
LTKAPGAKLFVREATGLVRQLSSFDVFVWSIIYFPWLTSWAGIFWVTPSYYQNVNYYAALALWAVVAMVIVLLYWQVTVVMPRAGGDYIFISRSTTGILGFVASFLFLMGVVASAGGGSYWAFAETGTQLSFAGQVLNDPSITALGTLITPFTTDNPTLLFGIGLVLMIVGGIAIALGGKVFRMIVYSFFAYGLLVLGFSVVVFLTHSPANFAAAYAQYFQGGVPKVFSDAAAKGYTPGTSLLALGALVPVLFVSIGPYPVMQMVGGEVKNPRRSLLYGLVLAEVVSILVWFGLTYLFDSVVGISFLEAWTLTAGGGFSTVPTVFVTLFYPSVAVLWFLCIGLFIGNIGWSWLGLVFMSRLVMSWSFDRVFPSAFANVNERFHTPHVAIALACILATCSMYLIYFTSFITAQVNGIFLFSIVWLVTAISAIILPFRRKSLFESSAGRSKIGGVPVISLLGLVGAILFAWLAYNATTNPAIGSLAPSAQLFVAVLVIVPVVIFAASYYYNKSRGIDLRLVAGELPPD